MIKHNIYSYRTGKITNDGFSVRSNFLKSINSNSNNSNSNNSNNSNSNNSNNSNSNNSNNSNSPTFNILVATIARDTLENLIESLADQLNEDDCLTIVFDNNTMRDIKNIDKIKAKIVIYNEIEKLGYWGHGIRNKYAYLLEKRDFVLHADDDDSYFPNSLKIIRRNCLNKNTLYIAKMVANKFKIPRDNIDIMIGNISTGCGIIPYNMNEKANWGYFYGGDGKYYIDLIKKSNRVIRLNLCIYNYENKKENLDYYNMINNS